LGIYLDRAIKEDAIIVDSESCARIPGRGVFLRSYASQCLKRDVRMFGELFYKICLNVDIDDGESIDEENDDKDEGDVDDEENIGDEGDIDDGENTDDGDEGDIDSEAGVGNEDIDDGENIDEENIDEENIDDEDEGDIDDGEHIDDEGESDIDDKENTDDGDEGDIDNEEGVGNEDIDEEERKIITNRPTFHPSAWELIRRCRAKDEKSRPTMGEVVDVMESWKAAA